jgi:hypothetical protein
MCSSRPILMLVGGLCWAALPAAAADPTPVVNVESLLDRMVDLRWLAREPAAGERAVQFSSYDRATQLEAGKITHPFANGDRGHYLRVDEKNGVREFVLAEAEGPGFVSRIWSANPDGELHIYIDGDDRPALAADFARITDGQVEPFAVPFGHDASRGRNLYFPFPFAQRLKITTTKGDQYYQVDVATLPKGTAVESYSPKVLKRAADRIKTTRGVLLRSPSDRLGRTLSTTKNVHAQPGQTVLLADLIGTGAIAGLQLKLEALNRDAALARSLLTITFDDAKTPQVAAPVGDFFGSGPGVNPYRTTVAEVDQDGTMTCRWYLPYRRRASIELTNGTSEPVEGQLRLTLDPSALPEPLMHFHARWRQQDGLRTKKADGTLDWRALDVHGKPGRYVGMVLDVFNPTRAWWGEGDEKVYVDREPFPSTFGTGTEDYFGYAWCDPHPFARTFHAQTRCDGPGNRGNTSVVRYQVLDAIPWHESIAFDLEVWHWESVALQYGTLVFFYAGPEAAVGPGVPDLSGRVIHRADEGERPRTGKN